MAGKQIAFAALGIFFLSVFECSCNKNGSSPDSKKPPISNSTIVYTDVNPDSTIGATYNLDLDNDGAPDFSITDSDLYTIRCGGDDLFGYADRVLIKISVTPLNSSNEIVSNGNYTRALDSAVVIEGDSLLQGNSRIMLFGSILINGRCDYGAGSSASGPWINVTDKYLGLSISKGNNNYYGWARLSSTYRVSFSPQGVRLITGQLVLKDYAYNHTANQKILAGQTK